MRNHCFCLHLSRMEWLTSGFRNSHGDVMWSGDNTEITVDNHHFPSDAEFRARTQDPRSSLENNRIVYKKVGELTGLFTRKSVS